MTEKTEAASDKPAYIYRDGGMMFEAPYLQAETFLCGWLLPSTIAAQQKLLDDTVNRVVAGSGLRYEAVLPRLMLSFADIKRVTSRAAVHADHGFVSEKDVTIWFVARARRGDIERLVWFLPYIWVDDPLAVVVGREVFGFPKHLASMVIPADEHDRRTFFADAPVLATHQPSTRAVPRRLLEVRPPAAEAGEPPRALAAAQLERIPDALGDLSEIDVPGPSAEGAFASAGNLMAQFVRNLRERALPILFLKQFPDAVVPGRACYQRVVEANAKITDFDGIGLLPRGWTAELHSFDSHRLHDTLGVPKGPIRLGRGVYLRYSFSMEAGEEIT